jgi:hypothetical protein
LFFVMEIQSRLSRSFGLGASLRLHTTEYPLRKVWSQSNLGSHKEKAISGVGFREACSDFLRAVLLLLYLTQIWHVESARSDSCQAAPGAGRKKVRRASC